MNEDINELFGDLRSMLSQGSYAPRELFWLLDGAYEQDPAHYIDQWHHYLRAYSPLSMLITSIEELDKLPELLPGDTPQGVSLVMTGHHLRKWHFQEIADSEGSWFLEELDISDNRAENHYPTAFAHSETLINLKRLNMAKCGLHNLVAKWVLKASFLASVEDLDLSDNPLEPLDIKDFADNLHIARLERLAMARCDLDTSSLQHLLSSPYLAQLRHLDISGNPLTSKDLLGLERWERVEQLDTLTLPWDRIDFDTRQHLLDSTRLSDDIKDVIFDQTLERLGKPERVKR